MKRILGILALLSASCVAQLSVGSGGQVTLAVGALNASTTVNGQECTLGSTCTVHDATVGNLRGIPFCTGYTPVNGQLVQYTTVSSPNPCYTAATLSGGGGGSGSVNSGLTGQFAVYPSNGTTVGGHTLASGDVTGALGFIPIASIGTTTPTTLNGVLSGNGSQVRVIGTSGTGSVALVNTPTFITPNLGDANAHDLSVTGSLQPDGTISAAYSGGDAPPWMWDVTASTLSTNPAFSLRLQPAGGQVSRADYINADTYPFLTEGNSVGGTGKPGIKLGPGGSTAPDTNVYRSAAGVVKTDGSFAAANYIASGSPTSAAQSAIPSGAHGFACDESATAGVPAAGVDYVRCDSTAHKMLFSFNGGSETALLTSPLTTKGDLWAYGSSNSRLAIGADGSCLVADSTQTLGQKWGSCSGTGSTFNWPLTEPEAAAPASPSAGSGTLYNETTNGWASINSAGTKKYMVQAKASATTNQWLTNIDATGAQTTSQPGFSNLSGSVAAGQMPALTGDVTTSAGAVATTLGAVFKKRPCEIDVYGSGASSALQSTDGPTSACYNDYGATLTIQDVKCWTDSGTTTVNVTITGGGSTGILSSTMTCTTTVNSWTAGTLNGTPTQTSGNSLDVTLSGALGGTTAHVVIGRAL